MACQVQKAPKESGAAEVRVEPREIWEPEEARAHEEHREQKAPQEPGARGACRASLAPEGQQGHGDQTEKKVRLALQG